MKMFTLIPLGNPGDRYAHTRHNVARIVLSMIKDEVMKLSHLEIMTPTTFMNESGKAVADYLRYHSGREVIIMYDDKDLAYGTFRISYDRGDGGHNGLKSVIESLGKKDFIRIRIGIAPKGTDGELVKPPHGDKVQGYVMGQVTEEEVKELRAIAHDLIAAIRTIVDDGYTKAMEKFN
jgi:PTH1 family peptidyl-tRNA hydrolase